MKSTLIALVIVSAIPARSQLSGGMELDFNSRYTWRGMVYSSGPVLQPDVWISWNNFTLSGWNNADLTHEPQQATFNSASGSLDYSFALGKFQINPMVEYWADRQVRGVVDKPTGEVSVNISHPLGPLIIYLLQAVDVFQYRGAWYGETGASRQFHWKRLTPETSISLGAANRNYLQTYAGVPKAAFVEAGPKVEVKVQLSRHYYLRPHVEWTYLLNNQVRRMVQPASLWSIGGALGVTF